MRTPLAEDLDRVLAYTSGDWESLRGARVFLTGGTGFVGCWLLEAFLRANDRFGLGASVVVLTRDSARFAGKTPHLAGNPAVSVRNGDVRTLPSTTDSFTHVVHAAADGSPVVTHDDRLRMFDTIVTGTRRALDFACRAGAARFLLTSSGAVYGPQPPALTHVSEDYNGAPISTESAHGYGEAKRAAEMLCALYASGSLQPAIARCFTFVGPYLPLDANFAVGNFVRDALQGGPIRISGDGTPRRSYLYGADMAAWLWTILVRGDVCRPYNVGARREVTIRQVAEAVARCADTAGEIEMGSRPVPGAAPQRYVPDNTRAQELGLRETIPLEEGIRRMIAWHRERSAA